MKKIALILFFLGSFGSTAALSQTYQIEPSHTYPSFEADHMGISFWRGKFTKTSGTIILDHIAKKGRVDVTIDASSIDFGHAKMNEHAKGADLFNIAQFPVVKYHSDSISFDGDKPISVEGNMTMLGISKPVTLTIRSFKCIQHPMLKREVCGADAYAEFKRTDFGMHYATPFFSPIIKLAIQVEAIKSE